MPHRSPPYALYTEAEALESVFDLLPKASDLHGQTRTECHLVERCLNTRTSRCKGNLGAGI